MCRSHGTSRRHGTDPHAFYRMSVFDNGGVRGRGYFGCDLYRSAGTDEISASLYWYGARKRRKGEEVDGIRQQARGEWITRPREYFLRDVARRKYHRDVTPIMKPAAAPASAAAWASARELRP
jgi:hypothetical protein